jgi:glycosyltransferase involved in cell wall biosynthesis
MVSMVVSVRDSARFLRGAAVDGLAGFVVVSDSPEALDQASLRILKDPALAARMGYGSRQRIGQKFSIERTADEHVRAYEDVIRGDWK